ncbi:MAG TPA: hypothetical protein DCL64_05615 [Ruminococcaceae bacterium]|jgi:phosphatidylserine/phosphatidylglycerophosphate/cardiolipin synthase-like enzyme|nr:hypothetical protein [Oscillospiraceae bacterium]
MRYTRKSASRGLSPAATVLIAAAFFVGLYAGGKGAAPAAQPAAGGGTQVQAQNVQYYFPRAGQKAQPRLVEVIDSARKDLDVAIYSFTDQGTAEAIERAKRRGVAVRIITDRQQSAGQYQKVLLNRLAADKIPVKVDSHSGIMHLKVTVADGKVATTGSFNYTKSAENANDEVFVVLRDEKVAQDFEAEFTRMWNDAQDYENYKS